jgi:hypothetical protein
MMVKREVEEEDRVTSKLLETRSVADPRNKAEIIRKQARFRAQ